METEISIKAQPVTPESCRFTLNLPLLPGGSRYFHSKEEAKGSPLVEALFGVSNVLGVLIAENLLTVNKKGNDDWRPMAREIGTVVRAQLSSGIPPLSEEVRTWKPPTQEIRERVEQLIANEINPALANHGGHVSLVDVRGNSVFLKMGGGCQGCGMADLTLKQGIEAMIRKSIPEVGEVLDTTDHAEGRNPYYAPSH